MRIEKVTSYLVWLPGRQGKMLVLSVCNTVSNTTKIKEPEWRNKIESGSYFLCERKEKEIVSSCVFLFVISLSFLGGIHFCFLHNQLSCVCFT